MNKGKYIGLNQRVPFAVLDAAIDSYLRNEAIDKESIFRHMQEFTPGLNRASKAAKYVTQIITRQEKILKSLKTALAESDYSTLPFDDRRVLSICLISLTYPITYDLLTALAQGFKVQNQINKQFISEKVMTIYGSNRTVDVAIDALLPMIIELGTIRRDKVSIYSLSDKLITTNRFIAELVVFTDVKLSGSKSILIDDIAYKPWFSYFDLPAGTIERFGELLIKKDSAVGKGYLTIK